MANATENPSSKVIGKAYSEDFWTGWPEVYEDLCKKMDNREHPVTNEKVNNIFRAVLAIDHLKANLKPGAAILDAACGIGYNSVYLAKHCGFQVESFDISDMGITRSKELAQKLGLDPNMFTVSDHTYMEKVPSGSKDVVIGMGFLRYVDAATRDYCYKQFARVLKKGGILLLTHQNALFEPFAMNQDSLQWWANLMLEFAPIDTLMGDKSLLQRLQEKIKTPQRQWRPGSISRSYETNAQNPLTYAELVKPYGFSVERIAYPDCHLLPPMLEVEMDAQALSKLKGKYGVQKADDWRGLFMCYEFMAFMKRA